MTDLLTDCRILNKFLDSYEEDVLPWHESIEPCLSSITALFSDREVGGAIHLELGVANLVIGKMSL